MHIDVRHVRPASTATKCKHKRHELGGSQAEAGREGCKRHRLKNCHWEAGLSQECNDQIQTLEQSNQDLAERRVGVVGEE